VRGQGSAPTSPPRGPWPAGYRRRRARHHRRGPDLGRTFRGGSGAARPDAASPPDERSGPVGVDDRAVTVSPSPCRSRRRRSWGAIDALDEERTRIEYNLLHGGEAGPTAERCYLLLSRLNPRWGAAAGSASTRQHQDPGHPLSSRPDRTGSAAHQGGTPTRPPAAARLSPSATLSTRQLSSSRGRLTDFREYLQ
jgi:hypothetical protein